MVGKKDSWVKKEFKDHKKWIYSILIALIVMIGLYAFTNFGNPEPKEIITPEGEVVLTAPVNLSTLQKLFNFTSTWKDYLEILVLIRIAFMTSLKKVRNFFYKLIGKKIPKDKPKRKKKK